MSTYELIGLNEGTPQLVAPTSSDVGSVVGTVLVNATLTFATGSITDSSGAITFGNENLVTTGTFGAAAITGSGVLSIDDVTDTTSGTSGSIHTDGGVGVAKALYVGTTSKLVGVTTHGGNVVSDTDSTDDLGTTSVRWANTWSDTVTGTTLNAGTLALAAGSITDSSGSITFVNENLVTTGTFGAGVATLATGSTIGNLTLANGSITDSSGSITFVNENLVTTGTFGAGAITGTGFIIGSASINETELEILDGATITTTELNYLDLVTLGTSAASKVVTADANNVVTFTSGIYEEFLAVTSSSNATTVNLRLGTHFLHDLTEATTFTFSNPAASGLTSTFTLKIIQDSSARAITWPAAVDWPASTAPTLTSTNNGVDYFVFTTNDGGTTWYGFTAGQAMG